MAKERVQVQGIGGAVPGISPTIQRGGQYSVQVQQAGRNKLMDLADALGQVNPLLQQYGKLQKVQEQIGIDEAELIEDQNIIKEAQRAHKRGGSGGFSPFAAANRERAKRDHLIKRYVDAKMLPNLQAKVPQLLNPSNYKNEAEFLDTVQTEIDTEWSNLTTEVGSDFANSVAAKAVWNSVANPFKNKLRLQYQQAEDDFLAQSNVDAAGLVLGDLHKQKEEVSQEELAAVATNMDNRLAEDVPGLTPAERTARIVSAYQTQAESLYAEGKYRDADKLLDNLKGLEVNGVRIFDTGSSLEALNRTRAKVNTQIKQLDQQDDSEVADDIYYLYNSAAAAVASGLTGDENVDNFQKDSVIDYLLDAGYDEQFANDKAQELLETKDFGQLEALGLKYREKDITKEAWRSLTGRITNFSTSLATKTAAVLSKSNLAEVDANVKALLDQDPKADVSAFLRTGAGVSNVPITDPRARASALTQQQQSRASFWYEDTEPFKTANDSFEQGLDAVVDVELYSEASANERQNFRTEGRNLFQDKYLEEVRAVQKRLSTLPEPQRSEEMRKSVQTIQNDVEESWRDFKLLERNYNARFKPVIEEEPEQIDIPELLDVADDKLESVLDSWYDASVEMFKGIAAPSALFEQAVKAKRAISAPSVDDLKYDTASRNRAFSTIEFIDNKLGTKEFKDNAKLQDSRELLRKVYGYKTPEELTVDDVEEIDFRTTPVYESGEQLLIDTKAAIKQIPLYQKAKTEMTLDDVPQYKLLNEKFGINTMEQLKVFFEEQKRLLGNIK
jgi:hypothetical protein